MRYSIEPGLAPEDLPAFQQAVTEIYDDPAERYREDGSINYRKAGIAAIVMCTVTHRDEILLMLRSRTNVGDAKGAWSVINGLLDKDSSIEAHVVNETKVEAGITIPEHAVIVRNSYLLRSEQESRPYIVFPCWVPLNPTEPRPYVDLSQDPQEEHDGFVWALHDQLLTTFHAQMLDDLPLSIGVATGRIDLATALGPHLPLTQPLENFVQMLRLPRREVT